MSMGTFHPRPSPPLVPQTLLLPAQWQSEVDTQSVLVRSKPFSDAEELQPVCYRCSTVNPLLNTQVRMEWKTRVWR